MILPLWKTFNFFSNTANYDRLIILLIDYYINSYNSSKLYTILSLLTIALSKPPLSDSVLKGIHTYI